MTLLTLTPHEVSADCELVHCFTHQIDEIEPPDGGYIVCGECFHVFNTARDLIEEFIRMTQDLKDQSVLDFTGTARYDIPVPPVEMIFFCPFCAHDF